MNRSEGLIIFYRTEWKERQKERARSEWAPEKKTKNGEEQEKEPIRR